MAIVSMKFSERQVILHVRSNTLYVVLHTPELLRIEKSGEPGYAYTKRIALNETPGPIWVRAQDDMEHEGRFAIVD